METILNEDERIDDLELKGLKIIQNKKGFCFGIDSILLSNYAKEIKKESKIVDLGTGTGILPILLSAKTKGTKIVGIEIQKEVAQMANRSILLNNLQDRIEIVCKDIKEIKSIYEPNSFDAIVTNPPYKKQGTGAINRLETKIIARHEIAASLEDFVRIAKYLLKDQGDIYIVHRPERLVDLLSYLRKYKLEPKTLRFVQANQEKEPNLVLIKATKNAKPFLKIQKPLIIYKENGSYTKEILEIYHEKGV
ncbi:MAG: tRNA1(Val) (adenine(37)-N6)-methyltransferase [Clostridia bacterium]|jgi:tRNA1Val (adenine37-N6)-methyltransferase|nr:tRNA1(Val) (adenine(37)-N6)-methyltransferase [Clostridia bacterium]